MFISLLGMVLNASALDSKLLINQANRHYTNSEFDEAIKKYLLVINDGHISPGLYFNLGNSYFKTHNIKNAILYYEKAKLLDPGDKDIDNNLELARSQTFDKIDAIPPVFFVTWCNLVQNKFSKDTWALISIISFILSLSMFLLYLLTRNILVKKTSFWTGIVVILITVSSFIFAYHLNQIASTHNKYIIFTPIVYVKSSPSDTGNNLFIIHEGTKVEVIDKLADWDEIKIADGSRGWIKDSDMEAI